MKARHCRGHLTDRLYIYACKKGPTLYTHVQYSPQHSLHSLAVSDGWVLSQHGTHGGHLISNPLGHFFLACRRATRVEVTKGTRVVECENIGFVWQKGHVGFLDSSYLCDRGKIERSHRKLHNVHTVSSRCSFVELELYATDMHMLK